MAILDRLPFIRDRLARSGQRAEHLRADFKARYHSFKLLLTANNRALDIMGEMENALRGDRPLGMGFVRSRCTRVAASVFRIIKHLNEISPGKYEVLYERFKEVHQRIGPFIVPESRAEERPLILPLDVVDRSFIDQTGSKMANLGELGKRLGMNIPKGFVVTAEAYRRFMRHGHLETEIEELIQSTETESLEELYLLSESIRERIVQSDLPEEVETAIKMAHRRLADAEGERLSLVLRSSALGEDAAGMSFAGQYQTKFNVTGKSILEAYRKVVASKYRIQAMMYRLNRGVRDEDVAMCVGCTAIVDAASGGVAYSRNPTDRDDESITIHSVWGLPKPVVDGSVVSDLFAVATGQPMQILRRQIAYKPEQFRYRPDKGCCSMEPTGVLAGEASLDDERILELARLVRQVERHYGVPQDIEWALGADGGGFFLLQSRPLQQLERWKDEDEEKIEERHQKTVLLLGGVTASPGVAAGPVFIVRKENDALEFPDGGVLVAAQSLPYWATLMNRAAAMVTEQGSIVGHLANVAREFDVPAIFGVPGATERLVPGRWVTVDADRMKVHEGRIEELLARARPRASRIQGSPVYESLKNAAEHIIPLRLLDPDSSEFKAQNCRTFHDITRYCHEKAVREMFDFGIRHTFPEHSSKQLVCDVPMQFWVLDLDDGFAEDATDPRYVRLGQILSIPMLALWRGMTAVPWEGPPPVDTRGFLSVLMESASDPALNPTVSSPYSARNYFMISANFCSLQSRFGYHFSSVEALVGERDTENYISFQFKGGAANLARRVGRARLVSNILEEYGFRTDPSQDSVRARLEGYERSFVEARLKVLGYLIIHTRQLDMVMTNEATSLRYRAKLRDDLRKLVSGLPAEGVHEDRPT